MGSNLANVKHNIFLTYCHEVVGVAMRWLVKQHFPLSAIGEAKDFQQTLTDLPKGKYDLVVLDAEIGDNTHLLGTVQHIKSLSPLTRILILSEQDETVYGPKYLSFGTHGFLAKNADVDDIVHAIEAALRSGAIPAADEDRSSLSAQPAASHKAARGLSPREHQIADLLIKGTSLSQISKFTNLKETTISTYKKRIFKKVGVKTLSDLIALWEIYR